MKIEDVDDCERFFQIRWKWTAIYTLVEGAMITTLKWLG